MTADSVSFNHSVPQVFNDYLQGLLDLQACMLEFLFDAAVSSLVFWNMWFVGIWAPGVMYYLLTQPHQLAKQEAKSAQVWTLTQSIGLHFLGKEALLYLF